MNIKKKEINKKIKKYNADKIYINIFFLNDKFKILIIFFLMIFIIKFNKLTTKINMELNEEYLNIQKNLNLSFNNKLTNKIKIGVYSYSIKNGGRARMTASLINYLHKVKIFNIYLFTKVIKEKNEYFIPANTKRMAIKDNIIKYIKKKGINCLIYELDDINEIRNLNDIKNIKIIFYHHSSNFDWIYGNYSIFKNIYEEFLNSKYFVSIIPFENEFLFKKWGIRSIFINDFITFNYNSIIPSDLSSKKILMIGRGNAKKKRFQIGILSMEYIIKEIINCELYIISNLTGIDHLQNIAINLNLENNINFIGYSSTPEIFFKNASLNLFPSISESFGLVLCETKIYGIPNILLGLDYLSISKGGTIIIYDDSSESLAKEVIKILIHSSKKKYLGKEGRKNIKQFNNDYFFIKWMKLVLSVLNGDKYYQVLRENDKNIYEEDIFTILNNQIKLLKKRIPYFYNITLNKYINYTYMKNII